MAHNTLSEQLDQITKNDLGFPFDEDALWDRLEGRLEGKAAIQRRWLVAACLFILVFLAPFTLLKEWSAPVSEVVAEEVIKPEVVVPALVEEKVEVVKQAKVEPIKTMTLEGRGVSLNLASIGEVELAPAAILQVQKQTNHTPQFAVEDISIIQASLEKSKVEKERGVSIRAQWQTTSSKADVNYQALKFKLNEKEN